jgi:hypothetical protein
MKGWMRRLSGAALLLMVPVVSISAQQSTSAPAKPTSSENYQLVKNATFEVGINMQLSLRDFTQSPTNEGDIKGKVDVVTVWGKPVELVTNDIIHEGNKAWVVTKKYGKIRISGGYQDNCPTSGLCVWLTPSQQAQLKAEPR